MNYYSILGVTRDASTEEIERAFRLLARHVHPDLHGGDGASVERMKELNIIRATLTDADRRAIYDADLERELMIAARPTTPSMAVTMERKTPVWQPTRGAAWLDKGPRTDRYASAASTPFTISRSALAISICVASLIIAAALVVGRILMDHFS